MFWPREIKYIAIPMMIEDLHVTIIMQLCHELISIGQNIASPQTLQETRGAARPSLSLARIPLHSKVKGLNFWWQANANGEMERQTACLENYSFFMSENSGEEDGSLKKQGRSCHLVNSLSLPSSSLLSWRHFGTEKTANAMIAIFDLLKAFPVEKTWSAVAIGPAGPQVIFCYRTRRRRTSPGPIPSPVSTTLLLCL